jgi:hypothetical protein
MKKSVIAAVAASNMTIFSGLVNASVWDADGGEYSGTKGRPCTVFNGNCREHQLYPPNSAIFWGCDCLDEVTGNIILMGAICEDQHGTDAKCR